MTPLADNPRHDVRMDGVYFVRASADGPFAKSLEPGNYSYCVMVQAGRMRLETDFPVYREIELGPGDAVAVSGLSPHMFRSWDAATFAQPGGFERRPMTEPASKAEVRLILGVAPNEALALGSLMLGPIVVRRHVHPDLARRLWRAVEMLEDEYADESWIDRNLVIRRLAEIMLVNMSRQVFADRDDRAADGARMPANRQLMQAINAFFAAPERSWTLEDMARAAGMSRTRFAEAFKLATGQTPGRIISRMRLTAVARRLVIDAVSVEAAADEAGYSSSAAFVRAFQRAFGETPARWRRQRELRAKETAPRASRSPGGPGLSRGRDSTPERAVP
jgi:AraC-like DNA-binding protein